MIIAFLSFLFFAFSSNILWLLFIFIHKENIFGKKTVPL